MASVANLPGRNVESSSVHNYNYCIRLQNVLVLFAVMALSAHFAGCDFSSLGGCANNSMTLYTAALSVVLYNLFAGIFQSTLKNISWKVSASAAMTIAILFFWKVPSRASPVIVEFVRYFAFIWYFLQSLIIIDIAHEVHVFIIRRAELAFNFRGAQAAKSWYFVHLGLSATLFFAVGWSAYLLYSNCGGCVENVLVLGVTLCAATFSAFLSLSEQCNKGLLIPAIISIYSLQLCANAILSNPNTSCITYSEASIMELIRLRSIAKASINWLLLLTSLSCILYSAITGSSSVILLYKCFQSCVCRPFSSSKGESCVTVDACCLPTMNGQQLELVLSKIDNDSFSLRYSEECHNDNILINCSQDEEEGKHSPGQLQYLKSNPQFSRDSGSNLLGGSSSSSSGIESAGESRSLLRDHHRQSMLTDSDYSPCDTKPADDLGDDSGLLFHIQLGLSSCYLAVLLSDWTSTVNSLSGIRRNEYLEIEAMYLRLSGDYIVWILYSVVLFNSYLIYRHHNLRLRALIRL